MKFLKLFKSKDIAVLKVVDTRNVSHIHNDRIDLFIDHILDNKKAVIYFNDDELVLLDKPLNNMIWYTTTNNVGLSISRRDIKHSVYENGIGILEFYEDVTSVPGVFTSNSNIKTVILPDSALKISASAFRGCYNLVSITGMSNIESIEPNAFEGCSSLKKIELSNLINDIGEYAFNNCTALDNIIIPNNLTEIKSYVFGNCRSLRNISLKNIKIIDEYAFFNCIGLTEIQIPLGTTTIYAHAFEDCMNINSVYIPSTVNILYEGAFSNLRNLLNIKCYASTTTFNPLVFSNSTANIKSVEVNNVYSIPRNCFKTFASLKTLIIGDNVLKLEAKSMPASLLYDTGEELGIIEKNNQPLDYLRLGADLTDINKEAFIYYRDEDEMYSNPDLCVCKVKTLEYNIMNQDVYNQFIVGVGRDNFLADVIKSFDSEKIIIGEDVSALKEKLCYHYTYLKSVDIRSLLITTIPNYCFSGCTALQTVNLPANITTVNKEGFRNCKSLASITFNGPVINIGTNSFYMDNNDSVLASITFNGKLNFIGYNCFGGNPNCSTINYKSNLAPTYFGRTSANALYGTEAESAEYPWFKGNGGFALGANTVGRNKFYVPANSSLTPGDFEISRGAHYLFSSNFSNFVFTKV